MMKKEKTQTSERKLKIVLAIHEQYAIVVAENK
jgi:hypothetical protein